MTSCQLHQGYAIDQFGNHLTDRHVAVVLGHPGFYRCEFLSKTTCHELASIHTVLEHPGAACDFVD